MSKETRELVERLEAVSRRGLPNPAAAEISELGQVIECPMCAGNGEAEADTFMNCNGYPVNLQFIHPDFSGIGGRVTQAEQDYTTLRDSLPTILTALRSYETLAEENERLREALNETDKDLVVLSGHVHDTAKTDPRWEGMYERVRSWIDRNRNAIQHGDKTDG